MRKGHSKFKYSTFTLLGFLVIGATILLSFIKLNILPTYEVCQEIDNLNGVSVFYNLNFSNVSGRNFSSNGYNLGLTK